MKKEFYLSSPASGKYDVMMRITNKGVTVMEILILSFSTYQDANTTAGNLSDALENANF